MLDLLTILFVFLTLLGLALFTRGWRGRRLDNHPWCRACRFNLQGRWPGANRCPECGASLETIGAVEVGQRRRRWMLSAIGLLLLIGCGVWLSRSIVQTVGPVDWMQYKPDWWIVRNAHSADDGTADAALAELVKRIDAGELSSARLAALTADGLELQADESAAWRAGWGDVIEAAWKNGSLSSEQILKYAQHAVDIQMVAEAPKVRRWEIARAGLQPTLLRTGSGDLTLQLSIVDQSFGGIELRANPDEGALFTTLRATTNALMATTFAVLPEPGERELNITWSATLAPRTQSSMVRPLTVPSPATWDMPLATTITVLPPADGAAELVTDEAVTAALRESIEVQAIGLRVPPPVMGTPSGRSVGGRIVVLVTWRNVPIAAQLQLVTRHSGMPSGSRQVPLNLQRGSSMQVRLFIHPHPDDEPQYITAQFTADVNKATGRMFPQQHSDQTWYGRPIEFSDIPVTWYDTADDPQVPADLRPILTQPQGGGPLPGTFERGTIRRRADGP